MKRFVAAALFALWCAAPETNGFHLPGNRITWNREVAWVFFARCATCHREGGSAFSLMTFQEVQPRIVSIRDAVLSRRMPPWGAVKGFGEFENDFGLSAEEIELITDWIESGARRGNNPNVLPKTPKFSRTRAFKAPKNAIPLTGDVILDRKLVLEGLFPERVPPGATMRIIALLPDESIEPLVWLYEYSMAHPHPFYFKKPLTLPAGTRIHGVAADTRILLLPG